MLYEVITLSMGLWFGVFRSNGKSQSTKELSSVESKTPIAMKAVMAMEVAMAKLKKQVEKVEEKEISSAPLSIASLPRYKSVQSIYRFVRSKNVITSYSIHYTKLYE